MVSTHAAVGSGSGDTGPRLDLFWIPLGAGTPVVRLSGRIYEAVVATAQRRARRDLYHAALIARLGPVDAPITVEVAPVPDDDGAHARGVVAGGPVGSSFLGRWRLFRYEVRRWSGGVIPDLAHAVASPVTLSRDVTEIAAVLERLADVPTPVWGRDELELDDMWNSNSVVSWTLAGPDLGLSLPCPPPGGRAPGWDAGLRLATRSSTAALCRPTRGTP